MSEKIDYKKSLKVLYNPAQQGIHIVEVPPMNFLMADGTGDPNISVMYQQAVETLYSLSYGIKFSLKSEGLDYVVPPLEGLWWMDDMNEFSLATKSRWKWTMMIMQPDGVTSELFEKVMHKVEKKLNNLAELNVRLAKYNEGLSVQTIFIGPYESEAPVIEQIHKYILKNGFRTSGKHHEIYLSDPRKTPPEKWKTILRQPIQKV